MDLAELTDGLDPFRRGISYAVEKPGPDQWSNHLYIGEPSDDSENAWNQLIRRASLPQFMV